MSNSEQHISLYSQSVTLNVYCKIMEFVLGEINCPLVTSSVSKYHVFILVAALRL